MVTVGIDAHKPSHTVVAVDDGGRQLGGRATIGTTRDDHLALMRWAEQFEGERRWAVEDCRDLSPRLEADLLGAGGRIVRLPPKLMAHARDAARTYGKSNSIDARAVARAALADRDLPMARLDRPTRELRLLVEHSEALAAERIRRINRLRWDPHERDPGWDARARSLVRLKHLDAVADRPLCRMARRQSGSLLKSSLTSISSPCAGPSSSRRSLCWFASSLGL